MGCVRLHLSTCMARKLTILFAEAGHLNEAAEDLSLFKQLYAFPQSQHLYTLQVFQLYEQHLRTHLQRSEISLLMLKFKLFSGLVVTFEYCPLRMGTE